MQLCEKRSPGPNYAHHRFLLAEVISLGRGHVSVSALTKENEDRDRASTFAPLTCACCNSFPVSRAPFEYFDRNAVWLWKGSTTCSREISCSATLSKRLSVSCDVIELMLSHTFIADALPVPQERDIRIRPESRGCFRARDTW